MSRFVLLSHDHPEPHFDLLLEAGPVLRAWRLSAVPWEGSPCRVEPNFDHRLHYLTYEGPLTGGRGAVSRLAEGEYEIVTESATCREFTLLGRSVKGTLMLTMDQSGTWQASWSESPRTKEHS